MLKFSDEKTGKAKAMVEQKERMLKLQLTKQRNSSAPSPLEAQGAAETSNGSSPSAETSNEPDAMAVDSQSPTTEDSAPVSHPENKVSSVAREDRR